MLKWLQGRREAGGDPLITDDPLATIAGRTPRPHQPIYGVTRVNPLFREGPSAAYDEPGPSAGDSIEYIRPYSPVHSRPASPGYARPVSSDGSAPGGDLDTERVSVTSAAPARRPPKTPPAERGPPPPPPPAPPPRRWRTVQPLHGSHGWAGLDVLVMDSEYVSGLAVNLARLRLKSDDERRLVPSRHRASRKAPARRREPVRSTLVTNPEFVKGVLVATITAKPAVCPKLDIKTNSDYVVVISTRCRHTKTVAAPSPTNVCPKIKMDKNANYTKHISANCPHVKDAHSPRDWSQPLPPPSFRIGSPSQVPPLAPSSSPHGLPGLPLAAPDSIVTDSLLLLTSPDLSPAATLHARPLTPAVPSGDQLMPEHVLAEFSQVIANSRSVAMVRRASSDVRSTGGSSAGSVASQVSRSSSGRPDPAMAAAPVSFVTSLWERTGLRTNGRKLLVNEEKEEEGSSGRTSGRTSGARTPSPPVPPRLPISQSWLQRLAELPGLRPAVRADALLDPGALTAVVVQPALASAPPAAPPVCSPGSGPGSGSGSGSCSAGCERRVTFAAGAAGGRPGWPLGPPLGPPLDPLPSDQQRLWNTYYGAGAGNGYGALEPRPPHLQQVKRAAVLHDRKFSEFTLDGRGASALRLRTEERRRSKRLWRAVVILLVLAALLACIMVVSWYCTKGRHLFGAL